MSLKSGRKRLFGMLAVMVLLPGCESSAPQNEPGALPQGGFTDREPQINATTYFAHAYLLEQQGNFDAAAVRYQKAIELQSDFVSARNRLGITLNKLGRHEEATHQFRSAIAAAPGKAYLYNNLGFSLYLEGRLNQAEDALDTALRLKGEFARAHMNMGLVYAKQGRLNEAYESLRRATSEADACFNMGMLLTEAEKYAAAAKYLETAVSLKPDFDAARLQLNEVARLAAEAEALAAAKAAKGATQGEAELTKVVREPTASVDQYEMGGLSDDPDGANPTVNTETEATPPNATDNSPADTSATTDGDAQPSEAAPPQQPFTLDPPTDPPTDTEPADTGDFTNPPAEQTTPRTSAAGAPGNTGSTNATPNDAQPDHPTGDASPPDNTDRDTPQLRRLDFGDDRDRPSTDPQRSGTQANHEFFNGVWQAINRPDAADPTTGASAPETDAWNSTSTDRVTVAPNWNAAGTTTNANATQTNPPTEIWQSNELDWIAPPEDGEFIPGMPMTVESNKVFDPTAAPTPQPSIGPAPLWDLFPNWIAGVRQRARTGRDAMGMIDPPYLLEVLDRIEFALEQPDCDPSPHVRDLRILMGTETPAPGNTPNVAKPSTVNNNPPTGDGPTPDSPSAE